MKLKIHFLLITFFVNACCTKKDCVSTETPTITLNYPLNAPTGFTFKELINLEIDLKDNNFEQIETIKPFISLDTINYNQSQAIELQISKYSFVSRPEELVNNKMIIRIPSIDQADTLSEINYTKTNAKISCNKCFLGDGRADVVNISGTNYKINKTKWNETDGAYLITKKN